MTFTTKEVMTVRDIPTPHKEDMRKILDNILTVPQANPFHRSVLNSAYYVPKFQKVIDLLLAYQADMERIPYIGEKRER